MCNFIFERSRATCRIGEWLAPRNDISHWIVRYRYTGERENIVIFSLQDPVTLFFEKSFCNDIISIEFRWSSFPQTRTII